MRLKRAVAYLIALGPRKIILAIIERLLRSRKLKKYQSYFNLFKDKKGLEIGGPSSLFEKDGILPLYPIIGNNLDICNIDPNLKQVKYNSSLFSLKEKIAPDSYDFILFSHTLEHTADPLKALSILIQFLKANGLFFFILPHKEWTLDHKRPTTTFDHLVNDFNINVGENDNSHDEEMIKKTDRRLYLPLRSPMPSVKEWNQIVLRNEKIGNGHLHVFNMELAKELLKYLKLEIIVSEFLFPYHIALLAKKSPASSGAL